MKKFFGTLFFGATAMFGTLLGKKVFYKLEDPTVRAKIKNKFNKIKDAILSKEES